MGRPRPPFDTSVAPLRPEGYGETGPSSLSPTPSNERALSRLRGFGSAPLRDFGSAPLRDFGSAPLRDFGSAPLRDFGSALLRDFGSALLRDFGSALLRDFGSALLRDFGSALLRDFGSALLRLPRIRPRLAVTQPSGLLPRAAMSHGFSAPAPDRSAEDWLR